MKSWSVFVVVVLVIAVGIVVVSRQDRPVDYADDVDHFKYGSIGSEPGVSPLSPVGGRLPPEWVFRVLPEVCPSMPSYAELGLIYEKNTDGTLKALPIGISQRRRLGSDMLGINCALCHAGTVRTAPDAPPRVIPGMPPQQVDVQRLFRHLFDCIQSSDFTAENVVRQIRAARGPSGLLASIRYRLLIPSIRAGVGELAKRIGVLVGDRIPASGPGRLDTVNPAKAFEVGWDLNERLARDGLVELVGTMDFPPTWDLAKRDRLRLHWDGNIGTVDEAVLSAVLAVGAKPQTVDEERLRRVVRFMRELPPPRFPYADRIEGRLAREGSAVFAAHCADCHDFRGARVGQVTPIGLLGTDHYRLDAFSGELAARLPTALNHAYAGSEYQFRTFRKTDGYANVPLDGIWARAPYLHNGSVPTLRDLLEPERCRPPRFYRGSDVYDPENVGFQSWVEAVPGCPPRLGGPSGPPPVTTADRPRLFLFDTSRPGNHNTGHLWGTELPPAEKAALLEFLKIL